MTICRELCHAKDDIGLVIDARAGIANSRGIVVEFRTIVEDMSDANTPKNDKVDEFNDLKKAAEGGFIEVIKRIVSGILLDFALDLISLGSYCA